MKKIQVFLWLAVLWIGLINHATSQSNHAQATSVVKSELKDSLKVDLSVEARGVYDFRNYYADPGFGPATIPMGNGVDNGKRSLFDISSAVLGITKELSLSEGDTIKLGVQANLNKELTLTSVYAEWQGFKIGKITTIFCDSDACDLVGGKFVQVQWQYKLIPRLNLALAVEKAPDLVIYPKEEKEDRDKQVLRSYNNIPAASARIRYEQAKKWHAQLGGFVQGPGVPQYKRQDRLLHACLGH